MKHFHLIFLSLLLTACAAAPGTPAALPTQAITSAATGVAVPGGTYFRLSPQELQAQLAQKDFIFINTHVPYEGELEQTDAFIPYNTITQNLEQLPADKDAPIVVYCMSGGMSTSAAKELVAAGYTNVWELSGGMWAWEAAGLPILQK
ncbi:MAG: rhodanese-like domain-containing protein [Anaerolineales bacterium]|nr:rhodanese-like domain-containing protein [Anaerolineales bacterium]